MFGNENVHKVIEDMQKELKELNEQVKFMMDQPTDGETIKEWRLRHGH